MRLDLPGWTFCLSVLGLVQCCEGAPQYPVYEAVREWEVWKTTHRKSYDSSVEELEKHIVWHSNRVLIKQHNINADLGIYSYQVKINHLGDLVRRLRKCCLKQSCMGSIFTRFFTVILERERERNAVIFLNTHVD
jgi:hypothetical protein